MVQGYYAIGYWYYSEVEGWSLVQCVYFAVVTCTTIGYGDLTPTSDGSKAFTIVYAFVGVLGVATRRLDGAWSGSLARFVEFGVWHCQSCMGYHQYVAPYSANPQ